MAKNKKRKKSSDRHKKSNSKKSRHIYVETQPGADAAHAEKVTHSDRPAPELGHLAEPVNTQIKEERPPSEITSLFSVGLIPCMRNLTSCSRCCAQVLPYGKQF